MNYLGRPVFTFPVNWADSVNKSFTYDLKEIALGFGMEFFTSLQNSVVQGWQFSVDLHTDSDIATFDAFTGALYGRLVGFWLPAPMEHMQLSAFVDSTHFDIAAQGLSATWNAHPDIYLYFVNGATTVAAKIVAVTDNGNGTKRVTVDASLSAVQIPATTVSIYRLHYVRLADDTEEATFIADGWQKRALKVVELPEEYAQIETGQQPIYLYHFYAKSPVNVDWYYTSFAADVISQNVTYKRWSMQHGSIGQSTKLDKETLDIEAQFAPSHPFALYLPLPFSQPVNVEVIEVSYTDPDTQARRFIGQIRSVEDQGEKLVAHCDSFLEILERKVPRHLIEAQCNYFVFDPLTCKKNRFEFETLGEIIGVAAFDGSTRPTVDVTLLFPTSDRQTLNYFAQGFIETGFGTHFEMRVILDSSFDATTQVLTLTLNAPLVFAEPGQMLQVIPGCDGSATTCQTKFNNYDNFGGFPFVPLRNPTLTNVLGAQSAGGKK